MVNKKIKQILEKGVEDVIEKKHLEKLLSSGKKLRIKHGIDPTGQNIHLGRAAQLWKLRDFQDLGHKIVLIIGDFTGQIGDPSDKPSGRKGLTKKQIEQNMAGYLEQISRILDIKKAEVKYNSQWFNKLSLAEFLSIAKFFSVQQLVHRRNFQQRWKKEEPVSLQEICYPLLQGYDSVAIKADVELGGTDQLFNLKTGRDVQRMFGQEPQDIITLKMLDGLDGRKMSTSWGNVVNINDNPAEMYGKLMSMRDEMMEQYFDLCARLEEKELQEITKQLKDKKVNPKILKEKLAFRIVELYWGKEEAQRAQKEFEKVFKDKGVPAEIRTFFAPKKEYPIIDLLYFLELVPSKSEAKRLIEQGAVRAGGRKVNNFHKVVKVKEGLVIQVGKRKFARLTLNDESK